MNGLKYPPFLTEGDKIMIVSPSGKVDKKILESARKRLRSWGLDVVVGKHAKSSSGRFAGTQKQRVSDLQKAIDDKEIKAIFCSRGGYGAIHLIDHLSFEDFYEYPKWLIGYSDITLLHSLIQYNGYASLHSPMAKHLALEAENDYSAQSLKNILFGNIPEYEWEGHKLNRKGKATGILRGGNLSVLYSLRGTQYDLVAENTILFLEDIGECPYHIDRMMNNLRLGGVLEKLSGLIIGQFTEYEEDKSLGKEVYELIYDTVKDYKYPVCFNFPVGHVSQNYPLICGSKVELKVSNRTCNLKTSPTNQE